KKKNERNKAVDRILTSVLSLVAMSGCAMIFTGVGVLAESDGIEAVITFMPLCVSPLFLSGVGIWMVRKRRRYQVGTAVLLLSLLLLAGGLAVTSMGVTILALLMTDDTVAMLETTLFASLCLVPGLLALLGSGLLYRFGRGDDEPFLPEEQAEIAEEIEEDLGDTPYDDYWEGE
ncbi:MAG: hypothetical protein KDD89_12055, partial [Anaerolineales bacterium]|nr:hypothetical protein [Anaerolineales bacterium]